MRSILFFLAVLSVMETPAQKIYTIDANVPDKKIVVGQLKLGGVNPAGEKISVNNYYISVNDRPFIPVTGEFHFSRFPHEYWDESIKKMKAGGINTIATYVFWNIHEEKEGAFDWTGDKDLRTFIELCGKNHVYAIVRIGPFCHGEIRNGGLPDWLLAKPLAIRSNDPLYLSYVEKLYNEIGRQLNGWLYKDGGPVIGIQIENEYQHSAAPWGLTYPGQPHDFTAAERDLALTQQGVGIADANNPHAEMGNDHMKVLKSIAIRSGLDVPLYTATGWGYAAIIPNESMPVTAAYAYPSWTPKKDLSPFFLYKDMHKDPDYSPVRYKPEDYPVFPAELGSGIMCVYTRRPIAEQKSFDAMVNRCLGSGANGVGYYMYHGGSTPKGAHSFFSDEAYGLPKISYDFQAPIGEFGQVREGFHRLKLLHFFINEFADVLAPTATVLPDNSAALKPGNITDLRYAVRVHGGAGFLFINNFQDDTAMRDQENIQVKVRTSKGEIAIPRQGGFGIRSGENVIFPFNFDLNGANLIYATAQLLMKGDDPAHPYYVFFTPDGVKPEFAFDAHAVRIEAGTGVKIEKETGTVVVRGQGNISEFTVRAGDIRTRVLVVSKAMALQSYVVNMRGHRRLIFSNAFILQDADAFTLLSEGEPVCTVAVYPALGGTPSLSNGTLSVRNVHRMLSEFDVSFARKEIPVALKNIGQKKLLVDLPALTPDLNNIYLKIDYTGDTGMGFLDGELVTDEFYKGTPWLIGLRSFIKKARTRQLVFYFRPMHKDAPYLADLRPSDIPDFGQGDTFLKIKSVGFTPEYTSVLTF